jgi:hypothetical protein
MFFYQVDGKVVPGPLFDFGLLMYHNAQRLIENESGPFFYLSKVGHVLIISPMQMYIGVLWLSHCYITGSSTSAPVDKGHKC